MFIQSIGFMMTCLEFKLPTNTYLLYTYYVTRQNSICSLVRIQCSMIGRDSFKGKYTLSRR